LGAGYAIYSKSLIGGLEFMKIKLVPLALLAFASFCSFAVAAAVSTPAGFVTVTASAGTGTTRTVSVLSLPLTRTDDIQGQAVGHITGVTASTLSNADAGWLAGGLSNASLPFCIRITSGSAAGRSFLIASATQNSATAVTVDSATSGGVDLTTLGIVTGANDGDTYEIIACDTLASVFGTNGDNGVLAAATAAAADFVQLWINGEWVRYYLSTAGAGNWRRVDNDAISDDVPILPDTGMLYARLAATPLSLAVLGVVPAVARQAVVANSGTSFLSSFWPAGLTLGTSNLTAIPGWTANSSPLNADLVQIFVSGAWRRYYHDGTIWRRVGPNTPSNDVPIPVGTGVILLKKGSATGVATLSQAVPYNLE
jgi:hypothetical protein